MARSLIIELQQHGEWRQPPAHLAEQDGYFAGASSLSQMLAGLFSNTTRLLRRVRLPAHIIPLLIHAQQAQRLGLGQAVEVDDFDVADGTRVRFARAVKLEVRRS